jgi:heat shock protein HtpX
MSNTLKTAFLLTLLTVLLVMLGSAVAGTRGMVFAFVLSLVMNMVSYWFSDRIALAMTGAREVSPAQAPELHRIVEELATLARIPKPRVYVVDSPSPNAFATGRDPQHSAVAVTTGILRLLDRDELAGVLAHELAHIRHRDTLIASVVAAVAGAITMIANMAQWALFFGGFGRSRDDENSGSLLGSLLMIILAPLVATLIQLAISRSREFAADAGGAAISGQPLALASALEKLEAYSRRVPLQVDPAAAHLFIVNPLRGGDLLASLFSTHPPVAERVARLRQMALNPGFGRLATY